MQKSLYKQLRFIFILLINLNAIFSFAQTNACRLQIYHLTGDFYVYTTYRLLGGDPFPANSMYLITNKGAVLFDTPWDTTCFQPLLDSIKIKHHANAVMCVSTHFHSDRTAGLSYYQQKGIKTFTSYLTDSLSIIDKDSRAQYHFKNDTSFCVGQYCFDTYYAGEGHTKDNIVIWFAKEKILYGGCLVKSVDNNDIGFIGDANLTAWPKTMENLINKFHQPVYVIPGHFSWADNKSLEHTLLLVKKKLNG